MSEVMRLENIWKIYRVGDVETRALKGVSFSVCKGDLTAIMGPSGSGKSTLLNMLGLLDKPTSGRIIIEGRDVTGLSSNEIADIRNRKIGFVFQQFNLINRLTVLENIELPLIPRGIPRNIRVRRVIEALKMAGGDESWLPKKPNQLSGGQQQRVAIARAIVGEPEVILADEPTGNLDRSSARLVMDTFLRLNDAGLTIIIVTHDPEIANCTKKIVVLRDGVVKSVEEPRSEKCILRTT
ncbi:ABC transporter ATP-binding protein [Desulfurococcus amylolyticus]|uniref:ABC transporter, ATP binding subunit n=1 Tax=Desulfurococcus amylolyticus (strain DSM 18924 / JCM 16383 / VKM B-2413 / 1221n) TaxID=490899 RepID=B8D3Z0_DESA1|nr:ABC transporter ATP-binding protein [Desulfurococcus amylolyticus]ACL10821.1 ABC transporter, ATP binding subunit [Desulfurococcus amylolyticus 1221n]